MPGFGTGYRSLARRRRTTATAAPSAPFSAVGTNGWQATVASPSDLSMLTASVSRQGYDATASATTWTETFKLTKRVRQTYPNQASFTANAQALSDYVYSTDTIAGATNNSLEASPKPIAQWAMPHRQVVGNTLALEVVAFHRNARGGKQVAAVKFIATDGTSTVTQVVSTPTVSGRSGDRNPVIVHAVSLDISTLATGLVTVNAEVYPWIGAAASVLKSADSAVAREFSPRYFLKNTALAASPPYAYVKTTGNDATGVVSTTAATAEASPFLTVKGAIDAIHTAFSGSSGLDGAVIRIGNDGGTPFVLTSSGAARKQQIGCLTITRDPNVARANARVSWGATAYRPLLTSGLTVPTASGCIQFKDVGVNRTGNLTFQGEVANPLELIFDNVTLQGNSSGSTWLNNSHDYHYGTTFSAVLTAALGAGTFEHRIYRGIDWQPAFAAGGSQVEGWCIIGSTIANPRLVRGTRSYSGAICAFNKLTNPPTTAIMAEIAADENVTGFAFVQNVIEYMSATTNAALRISGDAATGSNTHVVVHQNTFAGAFQAGRWNVFYDEDVTPRTSKLQSVVGNIAVAVYTKSDVFRGANQAGGDASTRTGNFAFEHGVGVRGNFTQFMSAGAIGTSEAPEYEGLNGNWGTSQTVRNDPSFTAYAGTTVAAGPTYTAGAGGGAYTIGGGSTAKSLVLDAVLAFDFAGNARPTTNNAAGAYV